METDVQTGTAWIRYILAAIALGAVFGGVFIAYIKTRMVKRSELYEKSGRTRYQPRNECSQMHRVTCAQFAEIKDLIAEEGRRRDVMRAAVEKLIARADDRREATRKETGDKIEKLSEIVNRMNGRVELMVEQNEKIR